MSLLGLKIGLVDGSIIIGKVDQKAFELLKVNLALGAEQGQPLFVELLGKNKSKSQDKFQKTDRKSSSAFQWFMVFILVAIGCFMLLLNSIVPALLWIFAGGLLSPPAISALTKTDVRLTPKRLNWMLLILLVVGMFMAISSGGGDTLRDEYTQQHDALLQQMKADYEAGNYASVIAAGKKYETVSMNEFSGLYWDAVKKDGEVQADRSRKQLQAEFKAGRAAIIKDLKSHLAAKNFGAANSLAEKYSFIKDAELNKLSKQASLGWQGEQEKIAKQQDEAARHEQGARKTNALKAIDENTMRSIAITLCKSEVKRQLKSPSTADFPWVDGELTLYPTSHTAVFGSYVDAQNGFGAMIRTNYACTLELRSGSGEETVDWEVVKVVTF